jgi:hypothetical protein
VEWGVYSGRIEKANGKGMWERVKQFSRVGLGHLKISIFCKNWGISLGFSMSDLENLL